MVEPRPPPALNPERLTFIEHLPAWYLALYTLDFI